MIVWVQQFERQLTWNIEQKITKKCLSCGKLFAMVPFPKFKCQSVGDKVIYLEWLSHSPNLLQGWYAALPGAE